jgi:hypothetical protein
MAQKLKCNVALKIVVCNLEFLFARLADCDNINEFFLIESWYFGLVKKKTSIQ